MSVKNWTDDLASAVRYSLVTTRAIAVCPFHENVTIRVGDDAAESHAYVAPVKLSKVMARRGGTKFSMKKLAANSARQPMESALSVQHSRILKRLDPKLYNLVLARASVLTCINSVRLVRRGFAHSMQCRYWHV